MSDLVKKHCTPCEEGAPPLSDETIEELSSQISDVWEIVDGKKLKREFEFTNFVEALGFVNLVGAVAEKAGHHPNLLLHSWKKVDVMIYTHKIDGLSEADFILAAKVDEVVEGSDGG